jgi:hypothetical protein
VRISSRTSSSRATSTYRELVSGSGRDMFANFSCVGDVSCDAQPRLRARGSQGPSGINRTGRGGRFLHLVARDDSEGGGWNVGRYSIRGLYTGAVGLKARAYANGFSAEGIGMKNVKSKSIAGREWPSKKGVQRRLRAHVWGNSMSAKHAFCMFPPLSIIGNRVVSLRPRDGGLHRENYRGEAARILLGLNNVNNILTISII